MLSFNEEFGELIRETRKRLGLSRETFAELLDISADCLGKWERGSRKFPLEMLPLVTKTLQTTILFDAAGQIQIGEGLMQMNSLLNLTFQTFDPNQALNDIREKEAIVMQNIYERAVKAYEACEDAGWTFTNSMNRYPLDPEFVLADQLDIGDGFQFYPTEQKWADIPYLTATVSFDLVGDWLNLPRFIQELEMTHGVELAQFAHKVITYGCLKEGKGQSFYHWMEAKKEAEALTRLFPMLAPWSELITQQAQTSQYVEKYEGLLPDRNWYRSLGLIDEYQDQEFILYWETPDGEYTEVEDVESIRTMDELIQVGLIVLQEDYEQVKADYEASLEQDE